MNEFEMMTKACKMANNALANGYGPASESDELFNAIPGCIKENWGVYALIVNKNDEIIDWYVMGTSDRCQSGFGGYWRDENADLREEALKDLIA